MSTFSQCTSTIVQRSIGFARRIATNAAGNDCTRSDGDSSSGVGLQPLMNWGPRRQLDAAVQENPGPTESQR